MPAPARKHAPCGVGALDGEDESREWTPLTTTIQISLKSLQPFAVQSDNSYISERTKCGWHGPRE